MHNADLLRRAIEKMLLVHIETNKQTKKLLEPMKYAYICVYCARIKPYDYLPNHHDMLIFE